ncbi:MAG: hypothetical protein AB1778_00160 [Candidatus Bipolaricaulota bacterium]
MSRRSRAVVTLAVVVALAGSAVGAEVSEFGMRFDLTLHPFRESGEVRWNFALGAFVLLRLNDAWGVRAAAGFDLLNAGPYGTVGILRGVGSNVVLEGNVYVHWLGQAGLLTTTADAGARLHLGVGNDARLSVATFPLTWTIAARGGEISSAIGFTPSLTVDGALVLSTGLVVGEAVTLAALPVPAGLPVDPVLPLGSGWMLIGRLTTHIGFAP